jgi:hypothetical protein
MTVALVKATIVTTMAAKVKRMMMMDEIWKDLIQCFFTRKIEEDDMRRREG